MRLCLVVLAAVICIASAQFPNGRILEPPIPQLCSQRVIHERTPDGKFNIKHIFFAIIWFFVVILNSSIILVLLILSSFC